ncbi:MAG: lactate utilization protein, partial [Muribaculaceae bacterium]|nr:lactate utilization protein [Muribaculaceae bacterium]
KSLVPEGSSISWGGSQTIREMGLTQELIGCGAYKVIDRDKAETPEQTRQCYLDAMDVDYFLTSANAITQDGIIVNIDGRGNRVAAITWGPHNVIHVIGMNKVAPTIEAALARARNTAAPINTARLGCNTPCKFDGVCHNCNSPQCICNYIHFTRNSFPAHRHTVVLVGENWGY